MQEIYQIISNLKIIGKIPEGGRLSIVYSEINIYEDGLFSWLLRKYHNDSKERCCSFLHKFYRDLAGFVDAYIREIESEQTQKLKERKINLLASLRDNLKASVVGIENLIQTYKDYLKVVSSLELVRNDLISPLISSLGGYLNSLAFLLTKKKDEPEVKKRRKSF